LLHEQGIVDGLSDFEDTASQRKMVPLVQYVPLYRLKTLSGIERMHALPLLRFSDESLMRLGGFHAQQVRQGVVHAVPPNARNRTARGRW
jgi:hypothetical protein